MRAKRTAGRPAPALKPSLESRSGTAEEHAFVEDLSSVSPLYWDNGPKVMILGHEIGVADTPSAARSATRRTRPVAPGRRDLRRRRSRKACADPNLVAGRRAS